MSQQSSMTFGQNKINSPQRVDSVEGYWRFSVVTIFIPGTAVEKFVDCLDLPPPTSIPNNLLRADPD